MISKDAVRAYSQKQLDSFVWMKKLQRQELEREFKDWKVQPQFKTDPWLHQLVCFYIGTCYPQFMFLLDMGLGKTKILLDLMTHRVRTKKMQRALVTVPRLINLGSWEDAILEHSDLEPVIASGSLEEKWEAVTQAKSQVVVIDYAGLQAILCKKVAKKGKKGAEMQPEVARVREVARRFDFFAADESHKAKNRDSLRFRLLSAITKAMPARYATTGTLFGRNPEDLFAQFFLVDRGETFGETLGLFRAYFFTEKEHYWKGLEYQFNRGMTHELYRRVQHRSIRYDEDECLDLPERREIQVACRFNDEQREHYLRAVEGLINAQGKLKELDANFIRMRQIVSGYLQWKDDYGRHEVTFKENSKLDQLERLVFESGDSKIVVSHEYTRSGELITERLKALGIEYEWLHGGSRDPVNAVRRFLANPNCKVFLMNSEAGGTGTDGLQKQARYLIFFESPVSPITRKQVLKRVHRPGQEHRTFIYDLIIPKSIDMRVLRFIEEGKSLHAAIVDGEEDLRKLRLI